MTMRMVGACVAMIALAACSSPESGRIQETPISTTPLSDVDALARAKTLLQNAKSGKTVSYQGTSGKVVGVMIPWTDNEGFQALYLGVATAVIKGGASMLTASAQNRVETGSAIVQAFIGRTVDAIVLDPFDAAAFVPVIRNANQANIPVIAYDQIPVGGTLTGAFASDNKQLGAGGADLVFQAGQASGGKPTDLRVLELLGAQSSESGVNRHIGFSKRAKELGLTVVAELPTDWDQAKANAAVLDGFQAHPEINAIFLPSGCAMYQGVASALKSLGRFKTLGEVGAVHIVSIDGCPVTMDAIRAGYVFGDSAQQLYQIGLSAGGLAVAATAGNGKPQSPQLFPPKLVTKANVDDPSNWANVIMARPAILATSGK